MRACARRVLVSLVLGGAALGGTAIAQQKGGQAVSAEHRVQLPDQMNWQPAPPALPPGAQIAVLRGNPAGKSGDFAMRFRAPAGYYIPPHSHPTSESLTIISGSLLYGMGAAADRSKAAALPAGTYIYLPANNNHTVWAGDQGVVLDIQAAAPFDLIYVNPNDDPRKQQASTPGGAR
jgi:quercetin dioxygenase-like cupin family protein